MYSFENLSPEQIRDKLNELLCRADVADVLSTHADSLAAPLPELVPMFGFDQHNPHHDRDVWQQGCVKGTVLLTHQGEEHKGTILLCFGQRYTEGKAMQMR